MLLYKLFLHQTATEEGNTVPAAELLYKLFLHQTATEHDIIAYDLSCFINRFYIKPQLTSMSYFSLIVALLIVSTSNRNSSGNGVMVNAVALLIVSTSNRNVL